MHEEELSHSQAINQEAEWEEIQGALIGEFVQMGKDYSLSVVKGYWWDYQNQFWQGQCLLKLEPKHFWYGCSEDILDDLTLTLSNETVLPNQSISCSGRPDNSLDTKWFGAYHPDNRESWFGHADKTHNVSSADLGGGMSC